MKNKVIVITGASKGLGQEIAKIYLKRNCSLVLLGRDKKGFEDFTGKKKVDVILGDITKKETRDKLSNLIKNKYKRIDVLINNAGITYIQPFEDNTEEQLRSIIDVNLKAPILLTHEFYALMKSQKKGTIIFINSAAGKQGYPNHTLYSTTKFGLSGFSQSLRLEAKKHNIRVISIHAGGIKTALYDKLTIKPDISGYMDPQKIAEIVVYLANTETLCPDEISISRMSKS